MLIRDVAYSGLAKGERAKLHRTFAAWLRSRSMDELVEAQAYHLERAAALLAELEGQVPADLRAEAADVLERAGCRALAREANRTARRLLLRSIELEPSLERRFHAARAAWRLWELPAARVEMEDVRTLAQKAGERTIEGLALTQLAGDRPEPECRRRPPGGSARRRTTCSPARPETHGTRCLPC